MSGEIDNQFKSIWSIRDINPEDHNFIYSTWLNSYRYDSYLKSTPKSIYYNEYKLVVEDLLRTSKTIICCLRDSPEVILGYLVFTPTLFHYCFVKEAFRNYGLAKAMHKHANTPTIYISHKTNTLNKILKGKNEFSYNPFILFHKGEENGSTKEIRSSDSNIRVTNS